MDWGVTYDKINPKYFQLTVIPNYQGKLDNYFRKNQNSQKSIQVIHKLKDLFINVEKCPNHQLEQTLCNK